MDNYIFHLSHLNDIYYNCSECFSPIEIINMNEKTNIIEFQCINSKHRKKISIKEYIIEMKKFNNKNLNNQVSLSIIIIKNTNFFA